MKIITPSQFRANQKSYFEIAEKEKVLIHRKDGKAFVISSITEDEEIDLYFANTENIKAIKRGIEDIKAGRTTRVNPNKSIWEQV